MSVEPLSRRVRNDVEQGHAIKPHQYQLLHLLPHPPLTRYRPHIHFDVAALLANWNRAQEFSLELWASQYGVAGPWDRDTAAAIRDHLLARELAQATVLAEARVEAIHALYQRLAPAYAA